jgi:hypothetical protein
MFIELTSADPSRPADKLFVRADAVISIENGSEPFRVANQPPDARVVMRVVACTLVRITVGERIEARAVLESPQTVIEKIAAATAAAVRFPR